MPAAEFSFGVTILGAGRSSRMGRPKLLLPWKGTTVLGQLAITWSDLGASEITLVLAARKGALNEEAERAGIPKEHHIINPNPDHGMFSSIQSAAQWNGWGTRLTHWVVALGDQPHLKPGTLSRLLEFSKEHRAMICQPFQGGHGRHPIILPMEMRASLAGSQRETLKEFLLDHTAHVRKIEMDDSGLELDLDYPEDYERALRIE